MKSKYFFVSMFCFFSSYTHALTYQELQYIIGLDEASTAPRKRLFLLIYAHPEKLDGNIPTNYLSVVPRSRLDEYLNSFAVDSPEESNISTQPDDNSGAEERERHLNIPSIEEMSALLNQEINSPDNPLYIPKDKEILSLLKEKESEMKKYQEEISKFFSFFQKVNAMEGKYFFEEADGREMRRFLKSLKRLQEWGGLIFL
jgi:hypothetical protein